MQACRQEMVQIGMLGFRVRHWGNEGAPLLFMLHGWLDCGATFQFLIDALSEAWHVVAPDQRGHGGSHRAHEPTLFMLRIADLDSLLEHYSRDRPAVVIGHSMGANVASIYAGVRPDRVSHFVNLEGLAPIPGLHPQTPTAIIDQWLAKLRSAPQNPVYANHDALAERLRRANPRLPVARAQFLAQAFSRARAEGGLEFDVDPYEHAWLPMFEHERMVESTWPKIEAPVLVITGSESFAVRAFDAEPGLLERRLALLRQVQYVNLPGAGHNVHHEAPDQIAALVEDFLRVNAHQRLPAAPSA